MKRPYRWFCRRFLTRVEPCSYNRFQGRVISEDEWKGWDDALVPGWHAQRPMWGGGTVGFTAATPDEARAGLDGIDA